MENPLDPLQKRFEASQAPCLCCGNVRGLIYTGLIYSRREDEPRVCPWCIADGSAATAWNGTFNWIDGRNIPSAVREAVQRCTPDIISWQDLEWPICCNDACVFKGQAQYRQLTEHWLEAGRALQASYEPGWLGTETFSQFLEYFKSECDPAAYVFQCRHCQKWHVPWDIS
jgi:uncharacterized protein